MKEYEKPVVMQISFEISERVALDASEPFPDPIT